MPGSETAGEERCGSEICSVRAIGSTVVRVTTKTTAAGAARSGTRATRTGAH
jgi:hypothetical protein